MCRRVSSLEEKHLSASLLEIFYKKRIVHTLTMWGKLRVAAAEVMASWSRDTNQDFAPDGELCLSRNRHSHCTKPVTRLRRCRQNQERLPSVLLAFQLSQGRWAATGPEPLPTSPRLVQHKIWSITHMGPHAQTPLRSPRCRDLLLPFLSAETPVPYEPKCFFSALSHLSFTCYFQDPVVI